MHALNRLFKISLPVLFVAALFLTPISSIELNTPVYASTLEDQLEQVEKELAKLAKDKQDLAATISNEETKIGQYKGEIGQLRAESEKLQLEIAELELEIKELELNIQKLEDEITLKEQEITESLENMDVLEKETSERININYMDYRARGRTNVDFFSVKDANTYFKDSQYQEIIQDETNKVLEDLAHLRMQLERDQQDLEEKSVQVLRSKAIADEQHSQLDRAKADLQSNIEGYYSAIYYSQGNINYAANTIDNVSESEAKKEAEKQKIIQQLFASFNSIPSGQYVLAGTQIGNQGSTGWSTGPHLHFFTEKNGSSQHPCSFLPPAVDGCGWGNQLEWPLHGTFYYTSGYYVSPNLRCFGGQCSEHAAIDVAHSIWNAPVYAAHNGWMYKGVDQYGALYIVICQDKNNCSNGFKTGYWHLSAY